MLTVTDFTQGTYTPQANDNSPRGTPHVVECKINGFHYEIYQTFVDDGWAWRSGGSVKWYDIGFRNAYGFASYAEAAQDAIRDARAQC